LNAIYSDWPLDNRMTVVLFAGMGGGCDGLEAAGFPVHLAVNHDPVAVAVHAARHPHTTHLRTDVFEVDPRKATGGRGVRILHASPDCTHFSVAKGSKPVSRRRRSLAWVICRWMGTVRPEVVTMENVQEITTWGPLVAKRDPATGRVLRLDGTVAGKGERVPVGEQWLVPDPRHKGRIWRAWLRHVERLGYRFEHRVLVCADYGVPTIRKRFFGVARADGGPISWPERTHAPRKDAKRLGLKPWVGAHTIIDWSLPVKSIFGRKKPLAEATLRRTARGVMRYVVEAAKPFIVPVTHAGGDRVHAVDDPLRTLTTAHRGELSVAAPHLATMRNSRHPTGSAEDPTHALTAQGAGIALVSAGLIRTDMHEGAARNGVNPPDEPVRTATTAGSHGVVVASLIQSGYGEREGQAPRVLDIEEPAGTQVDGSKAALVAAFLAQHNDGPRNGSAAGRDPEEPLSAVTTTGSQQGVVAAMLGDMHGTRADGRPMGEPVATIAAGGGHAHLILAFLTHYFSNGKTADDIAAPLAALTGKVRHGLVTVKVGRETYYIDDIGMRMLEPEEGAAAHGFPKGALPAEITIDGVTRRLTKTEKYHLVGNSVPPRMVQLLAEANGRHELMVAAE
jgi:DNA (cytosine-5)-methyltransferase 1